VQTRKWQDKDGKDRYTTEIVLQDFKGQLILLGSKSDNAQPEVQAKSSYAVDDDDSQIPF
jgi:single-strand DNA-binding protein